VNSVEDDILGHVVILPLIAVLLHVANFSVVV
jgi:hypothetical protein